MKFNSTTHWISVLTMILYMLYILSAQGLVGLIVSLAIALIVAAFVDSFEIVTAGVVVAGVAFVIISRWMGVRSACRTSEGFSDGTPHEITTLMDTMTNKKYGRDRVVTPDPWSNAWGGPTGVLSDSVEGFADAGTAGADKTAPQGQPGTSQPEPLKASDNKKSPDNHVEKVTATLSNAGAGAAQAASEAVKKMTNPAPSTGKDSEPKPTSGFTDGGSAGLFKLGELPSESKDGPHLDAGSTLMKAMSSLQPDQINAMTADTQALLKTQQNLMGMLQSMQPILKDGRKLLDTFGGIFGGEGGAGMAKAFNLGA
jgi:hypothetical protein